MGTNYYLRPNPPCETCLRAYSAQHIGKSSVDWCFSLHVDPDTGINNLDDWRKEWSRPGRVIEDEYGRPVSVAAMEKIITGRRSPALAWTDASLAENSAERGPRGLARCQISLGHCAGHGEGTWDLILGEFS